MASQSDSDQSLIERLQRQLIEEQRRIVLAERRTVLAERRADIAEQDIRPTTLPEFLDAAHTHLSMTLSVLDHTLSTKGGTTDPSDKCCPTWIKEWKDFPQEQHIIWEILRSADSEFSCRRQFKSMHFLKESGKDNTRRAIGSEKDLESYERYNVETHVSSLIGAINDNSETKAAFGLDGDVRFENHANTLSVVHEDVRQQLEEVELQTPLCASSYPIDQLEPTAPILMHTDQICVYSITGNQRIPLFIVEYKPPHKLTLAIIRAGLHDMNPLADIVHSPTIPTGEADLSTYHSSYLVAAAIAQTFHYMISSGLEYGYICTGQALIFLRVPEDARTVYYYLSVPNADVGTSTGCLPDSDEPKSLHLTAIGQILAFSLRALQVKPRSQEWQENVKGTLQTWRKLDFNDVLLMTPHTATTAPSTFEDSEYIADLSPLTLRSRKPEPKVNKCGPFKAPDKGEHHHSEDETDKERDHKGASDTLSKIPQPRRSSRIQNKAYGRGNAQDTQERPWCTQQCLLGLQGGGLLDQACPNYELHGGKDGLHDIDQEAFLWLIQEQLAKDLDTDCYPLWIQGARGALFKITLTSHGYTITGKGTVFAWVQVLQHEALVYKQLQSIQGVYVPVCLGAINLRKPYRHGYGVYIIHMLFMAWGGETITQLQKDKKEFREQAITAIEAIHQLGVLHKDAMARNMLWSEELGRVLFIDFERAEIRNLTKKSKREIRGVMKQKKRLEPASPNLKRKRTIDSTTYAPEYDDKENAGQVDTNKGKIFEGNGMKIAASTAAAVERYLYQNEVVLVREVLQGS